MKSKIRLVIIIVKNTLLLLNLYTPEFNILSARVFNTRLAKANLETNAEFNFQLKKSSGRVTSNKSKHLLLETELKKTTKN